GPIPPIGKCGVSPPLPGPIPPQPIPPIPPQPIPPAPPATCPPCVPGEPPPPGAPPWTCKAPADFAGGVFLPGTPEWGDSVDETVEWFASVGDYVWDWIANIFDPSLTGNAFSSGLSLSLPGFTIGPVIEAIFALFRSNDKSWRPALAIIWEAIKCVKEINHAAFTRCNPGALTSLLVLRCFLRSLHNIEWGTDLALWLVDSLVVELPPLERTLDYLISYVCPVESPSVEEATEAYFRDYLSEDRLKCIHRIHGRDYDSHYPMLLAKSERISPKEAIQYVRRLGLGEEGEKQFLRKLGFIDEQWTEAFRLLYWELPSIGDHMEWMRRNVFD